MAHQIIYLMNTLQKLRDVPSYCYRYILQDIGPSQ